MTWTVRSIGPDDLDRHLPQGPAGSSWVLGPSGLASSLGSSPMRTAILAVALTGLAVTRRWRSVAFVVVTVAVVHLADRVAKSLFDRPRPLNPARGHALPGSVRVVVLVAILAAGIALVARSKGRWALWLVPIYLGALLMVRLIGMVPVGTGSDSYPSGHASNTLALCLALVLVRPPGRVWNIAAGLGFALVVAVGISRVTLGFHHPTDVLAGWFLATIVAFSVRPLFRLDRDRPDVEEPVRPAAVA